MSTSSEPPFSRVDFDDPHSPDGGPPAAADREAYEHALFLQGLLYARLGRDSEAEREARIARVLSELEADPEPNAAEPVRRGVAPWPSAAWLGVALALAVLVAMLPWGKTATAMLAEARVAAAAPVDRRYRVTVEPGPLNPWPRPRTGTLDVQGGRKLFLHYQPPALPAVRVGREEKRLWVLPPIGPLLSIEDRNRWPGLLREQGVDLPYLHISTILEQVQAEYRLAQLPAEPLPGQVRPQQRILATRGPGLKPRRIDLWLDADSGVVTQAVLSWPNRVGPGPRKVTLTLERTFNAPPGWYSPDRHLPRPNSDH